MAATLKEKLETRLNTTTKMIWTYNRIVSDMYHFVLDGSFVNFVNLLFFNGTEEMKQSERNNNE